MGYIRHHAIVVTATYDNWIDRAREAALNLGMQVSPIVDSALNNTRSLLIAPDGSKEGWAESDDGDIRREAYKDWLLSCRYDDLSSPLDWVEVQYGDDERETKIIAHSDEGWNERYAEEAES